MCSLACDMVSFLAFCLSAPTCSGDIVSIHQEKGACTTVAPSTASLSPDPKAQCFVSGDFKSLRSEITSLPSEITVIETLCRQNRECETHANSKWKLRIQFAIRI